ncbi:hypothetical protein THICB2_370024 [Thiomonas sp. CB2]|nr:hypothetical protein THICB2_370024 [Thiomonas sp. CB2]VDY05015.1 protein of unknown function [Thiomonas sp. Bio17B3]VDY07820.1 protein of unknown function [Thiomonas sp. Sup16B3]VDY13261.1 conserved protein of unknown function [Thiomonas sp. OC7]VDY17533.1 protein of unknown function [Thiomonas sp. CB2]
MDSVRCAPALFNGPGVNLIRHGIRIARRYAGVEAVSGDAAGHCSPETSAARPFAGRASFPATFKRSRHARYTTTRPAPFLVCNHAST